MNKKIKLAFLAFITLSLTLGTTMLMSNNNPMALFLSQASNNPYSLKFNKDKNKFHNKSGATPASGTALVHTELGGEIVYTYSNVIGGGANTWHVLSASDSYFYNQDPINGLESISLSFITNGKQYKIYWSHNSTFNDDQCEVLTSNSSSTTMFNFNNFYPNYVKIENISGNNLNISEITYKYSCNNQHELYDLYIESDDINTGKVIYPSEAYAGLDVTIKAIPEIGYAFNYWYDENFEEVSYDLNYSFIMPQHDVTLYANFVKGGHKVDVVYSSEKGLIDGNFNHLKGQTVSLVASPKDNNVFDGWYSDSNYLNLLSKNKEYSFIMPDKDVQLYAKFINPQEDIKIFKLDAGDGYCESDTIGLESGKPYSLPIPMTSRKTLNWEFTFDTWTLDGINIPTSGENWSYSSDSDVLVAKYKLRDDDEYLESQFEFKINGDNESYSIIGHKLYGVTHAFVYIPCKYKGKIITEIGESAFNGAPVVYLQLSEGLKKINNKAFYITSIIDIALPSTVTYIGDQAFASFNPYGGQIISASVVYIPQSVTHIGENAFGSYIIYVERSSKHPDWNSSWCVNGPGSEIIWGKTVYFEDGFGYIRNEDGYSLALREKYDTDTTVVIPESINGFNVTEIGSHAFEFNYYILYKVKLSNHIKKIGKLAFDANNMLFSIVLPSSLQEIGDNAFANCAMLVEIYNLSNIKITKDNLHYGQAVPKDIYTSLSCPSKITFDDEFVYYTSNGEIEALLYIGNENNVIVPNNVSSIGSHCFFNLVLVDIINVILPKNLKKIGDYAFAISSITTICIPKSVTEIGRYAFYGCQNLTILCEAASQPSGWNLDWNPDNRPVIWNSDMPEPSQVTMQQWFDAFDNYFYNNVLFSLNTFGIKGDHISEICLETVDYNKTHYNIFDIDASSISSLREDSYTEIISDSLWFIYKKSENDKWIKEKPTNPIYNYDPYFQFGYFFLQFLKNEYSNFTFDTSTNAYKLDSISFTNPIGLSVTINNVVIMFSNGNFSLISFAYGPTNTILTFNNYGKNTVTLPIIA
ncbi:MAG: leucine-rich repeat protein [Bacilli bacterium]|nr:leucine-rich repeat protein [Bacilli bacterium]